MKVLLVEDERPAADKLLKMLQNSAFGIQILGITESVEETVNWLLRNEKPELVFMDIQLDDGLCFDIFDNVDLQVPIIFTTAYNEYTLQAFKVNSIDYLLKPIKKDELNQALNKHQKLTGSITHIESQLKQVIQGLNKSYRNRFLIKIGANYKSVSVSDASYFFVQDKGTYLQTFEHRNFALDFSLDQITEMLDPEKFYRINRSCLVNIKAVGQLSAYSSSRLQIAIKNETKSELFVVSRDRVSAFKKWMDR